MAINLDTATPLVVASTCGCTLTITPQPTAPADPGYTVHRTWKFEASSYPCDLTGHTVTASWAGPGSPTYYFLDDCERPVPDAGKALPTTVAGGQAVAVLDHVLNNPDCLSLATS